MDNDSPERRETVDMEDRRFEVQFDNSVKRVEPSDTNNTLCIICKDDWKEQDRIIRGQNCEKHEFHHECLLHWLKSQEAKNKNCPLCRSLILTYRRALTQSDCLQARFDIQMALLIPLRNLGPDFFSLRDMAEFDKIIDRVLRYISDWYQDERQDGVFEVLDAEVDAIQLAALDQLLSGFWCRDLESSWSPEVDPELISEYTDAMQLMKESFTLSQRLHVFQRRQRLRQEMSSATLHAILGQPEPRHIWHLHTLFDNVTKVDSVQLIERNDEGQFAQRESTTTERRGLSGGWDGTICRLNHEPRVLSDLGEQTQVSVSVALPREPGAAVMEAILEFTSEYWLEFGGFEVEQNSRRGILRCRGPQGHTMECIFTFGEPEDDIDPEM